MTETKLTALKKLAVNLGVDADACQTNAEVIDKIAESANFASESDLAQVEQKIGDISQLTSKTKLLDDITYTGSPTNTIVYSDTFGLEGVNTISCDLQYDSTIGGGFSIELYTADGMSCGSSSTVSSTAKENTFTMSVKGITAIASEFKLGYKCTAAATVHVTNICGETSFENASAAEVLQYLLSK